jgi:hypothetical protein
MEEKQNEGQWFVIRHEKCGSVITINTESVSRLSSSFTDGGPRLLTCPNCGTVATEYQNLKEFLEIQEKFHKNLKRKDFAIHRIKRLNSQLTI